MKLKIDNQNIKESFDRIANELLNEYELIANNTVFELTEIEFYYFHKEYHPDNYTHKHNRDEGEWRFHNQGIDITFQSTSIQDGGILIRGIKHKLDYVNGPRKILMEVFKALGKVDESCQLMFKRKRKNSNYEIIKTFRHLPNKIQDKNYHDKPYRYLINLNNLDISDKIKEQIKQKSETI